MNRLSREIKTESKKHPH